MQCRSYCRVLRLRLVAPTLFMAIAACSEPGGGGKAPDDGAATGDPGAGTGVTLAVVRREGIPENGVELGYGWNTQRSDSSKKAIRHPAFIRKPILGKPNWRPFNGPSACCRPSAEHSTSSMSAAWSHWIGSQLQSGPGCVSSQKHVRNTCS